MAWTKVGRPSGIAEMAVVTQSSTRVLPSSPRARPMTAMTPTTTHATAPKILVSPSSSTCSGERVRWVADTRSAIRPIWVARPVSVTTVVAVPRVTWVFWKTRLVRSPRATSSSGRSPASFGTGALSPVSAASCSSSVRAVRSRPSAGTTSPDSSSTMSPGTRLGDSTSSTRPSRSTRALGTCSWASASTLARAASSCLEPITTLKVTRPRTTIAVEISPMSRHAAVTTSSMMFIGLTSCPRATTHTLGGASVGSAFGPNLASRSSTSGPVRPRAGSTPSRPATSSPRSAYQRSDLWSGAVVVMSASPTAAACETTPSRR